MKSFDYEAVVYDSEVYCVECIRDKNIGLESIDCTPIFADSEWDHYPVCSVCGAIHDYVSLIEED